MPTMAAGAAGRLLTGPFSVLAALRRGKPIHSRGTVFDATVQRHGSSGRRWGAVWLDEAGEDHGLARLSKSAGLPEPLPDVWGLALTFRDDGGVRHDLLVASTGLAPGLRHVLIPRRNPRRAYTTLLPYSSPHGPVLIAATPVASADPGAAEFRLLAAGLTSAWHPFGSLRITERPGAPGDEPVRFDPVLFPLPGMRWAQPLARVREPAYVAARRRPDRPANGQ